MSRDWFVASHLQKQFMTEVFNSFLVNPIINILVAIYKLLLFAKIPFAFGFSIVVLTILMRFLIYPFTNAQLKSAHKMQELAPHVNRIKEKYKNDKGRLQKEMMELYKTHNINPLAGCLPVIIQFPIFIALYNVLIKVTGIDTMNTVSEVNKILYSQWLHLEKAWDTNFFGISLATTPWSSLQVTPVLLVVPIITTVLQFVQSKMMMPVQPVDKNKESKDDFQKAMQTQMIYFLPFLIGFFSFTFPVGLSLYWNTFTAFGIIQQYLLNRKNGRRIN